ncbi:hypothetical protein H8E07_08440 [bacterium]|nr:hypothetical protein [bacterium]
MPMFMGMGLGVNWNADATVSMLPSLMGHMIFGAVLGFVYARTSLSGRETREDPELRTVGGEA